MNFPPLRSWLLVAMTSLIILSTFYIFLGRLGLTIGLILTLFWNYALLLHRFKSANEFYKGKKVEGRDPWNFNEFRLKMENQLRVRPTQIYISPEIQPLLIISNAEWRTPTLLLSQGTLELLTPDEVRAMITLGLANLKNRQTFFRYSLDRLSLAWMSLGEILDSLIPFKKVKIFTTFFYWIAWVHLKIAYPKSLQAKSDLEAYQAVENSRSLANALWKIFGRLDSHPFLIPNEFMHQSLLYTYKSRHTAFQFILPIELRLQFLVGYFPI